MLLQSLTAPHSLVHLWLHRLDIGLICDWAKLSSKTAPETNRKEEFSVPTAIPATECLLLPGTQIQFLEKPVLHIRT